MSRYLCNDCGASRGLQVFEDGTWCYACHKLIKDKKIITLNPSKSTPLEMPIFTDCTIPLSETYFLDQFYIKNRINIFWSEKYQRICFPYNNGKSCWMRTLDKTKKDKWVFVGEKCLYWTTKIFYQDMMDGAYENCFFNVLVITEDVISGLRCNEVCDSAALGGTNVNQKELLPILLQYDKIILWLDGDKAGQSAAQKFIKRYKHLRPIKSICTKKDPKCYSPVELEKYLTDVLTTEY